MAFQPSFERQTACAAATHKSRLSPLLAIQRLTAAEVAVRSRSAGQSRHWYASSAVAALARPVQIEYPNLTPLVYLLAGFTRRTPEDVAAVKLACT